MSIVATTSILVLVVMWFGLVSVIYFDIVINVGCMLLMHKTNEIFYTKICQICHNKLYNCCIHYIDSQRNKIKSKNNDAEASQI